MTNPIITIHNTETNEVVEREMNAEEFAEYEAKLLAQNAIDAEEANKAANKAALLARLGITAEEATLLLS